jgi:Zn-dependent protease with chaperone function
MSTPRRLPGRGPALAVRGQAASILLGAILAIAGVAAGLAAPAAAADSLGVGLADSTAAGSALAAPPAPDRVAEVRASFTPENRKYASTRVALAFVGPVYGLLAGLLILFSGLAARMRDIAHAFGRHRYVRVLVFLALYMAVDFVLSFPLLWFGKFALEHQYALSNQTFGKWLLDELKDRALSLGFLGVVPVVALAYTGIAKSPRRWWLWLSAGTLPVLVVGALIQPLVFDPAFNTFTPLRDRALAAKIMALAERAGIPGRNVYEVDKSAQTKKFNAYVNGFGASQRIVLWDTTLRGMKEDEILTVMGHEMGHYVLGHMWKGIAFTVVLAFALFGFSFLAMRAAVARFGGRWGFHELHDVASMPLLALTVGIASFVAQPLSNGFSRTIEHEADIFGLEITRTNDAAARAFIKLASQNRSDPEPSRAVKLLLYTHPPLVERVEFATRYHPWTGGRANRLFRGAN